MPMIRPEIAQGLWRAREVLAGGLVAALGVWAAAQGGYLLVPAGLALAGLGAAWTVTSWRRMRFAQATLAPGVVEIDEAQIGYLGPGVGGYVAIPDLAEVRLITMRGRRLWQLRQSDGQALLIPVDASGAERLFDAFASLPGIDTAALVAAVAPQVPGQGVEVSLSSVSRTLWQRRSINAVRPRPHD